VQRFWFFDPRETAKELMRDPEFVRAFYAGRVETVGGWWGSAEHKRLQKATAYEEGHPERGSHASHPDTGCIEIGFDFAQPYNFLQHATGLMFIR
jgi:hypothetical protein